MLVLSAEEAEDVVEGPDTTVGAPVVFSTLAREPDAGAEVVGLKIVAMPDSLAPTDPESGGPVLVTVVPESQLLTILVLVALPTPSLSAPIAALYALSARPSALLTAVSNILYCVPPHAVGTACNGAVKNLG